ncbi:hypothetical protein BGZ97_008501 [Linnemannia gamsii]|uniref:Uncharacterized protein n=1 Tax=Linnemannia gamsii TaxID=64522 RepID=A0A9P6UWC3_9FUNG|nr:hypothetical protein BGZ97_008501 [Linnemannia gamsii]
MTLNRAETSVNVFEERLNTGSRIRRQHFVDVKAGFKSSFHWPLPSRQEFADYYARDVIDRYLAQGQVVSKNTEHRTENISEFDPGFHTSSTKSCRAYDPRVARPATAPCIIGEVQETLRE